MALGQGVKNRSPRRVLPAIDDAGGLGGVNRAKHLKLSRELDRLRKSNSRLRRMEKLRADLAHMIVHDLKGPMAEVIANLSLLEEEPLTPLQKDYVNSAMLGAEELSRRVQNTLEVYRLETKRKMIRPTLFNPLKTIEGVTRGFATLASMKEVSIQIHSADGSHSLLADRDMFARVVLNLLSNAIEHTRSGGKIAVDLSWGDDLKGVQVGVSDEGPGIRKSDRKRIFQKFFTAEHGKSLGHSSLGLSFCKLAVEAHGGRIWVEDLEGPGSRLLFYLPNGHGEDSDKRGHSRSDE